MDDAAVVAEIVVAQFREAVEAKAANDQRVEMPGEEIGEVERARLLLGHRRERLLAGEEGVAMRAGDARHPLLCQHAVELAAGAAIAVEAEDFVVGRAIGADLRPHRFRDALRAGCAGCAGRQVRSIASRFRASISRASAPQAMTSTRREPRASLCTAVSASIARTNLGCVPFSRMRKKVAPPSRAGVLPNAHASG